MVKINVSRCVKEYILSLPSGEVFLVEDIVNYIRDVYGVEVRKGTIQAVIIELRRKYVIRNVGFVGKTRKAKYVRCSDDDSDFISRGGPKIPTIFDVPLRAFMSEDDMRLFTDLANRKRRHVKSEITDMIECHIQRMFDELDIPETVMSMVAEGMTLGRAFSIYDEIVASQQKEGVKE